MELLQDYSDKALKDAFERPSVTNHGGQQNSSMMDTELKFPYLKDETRVFISIFPEVPDYILAISMQLTLFSTARYFMS